ncbi:MAG: DUF58 domain-containing protein [Candidatus Dormibacteria bacterium]
MAVLGAIPLLGFIGGYAGLVFLGWFGLLLVATVREAYLLPPPGAFSLTRTLPRPLSLGRRQEVGLALAARGGAGLLVEAADHVPHRLRPSAGVVLATTDDNGRAALSYHVHPDTRGAYRLGPVDVRVRRSRGLWTRQVRVESFDEVAVYPDIIAVRQYEAGLRRALQPLTGARRTRVAGSSTSLASLREYLPGDDVRRISWKVSARRDQPITADYEAERGQQVLIALDTGRLMTAPGERLTKLDHAVNAALLLAWVAQSHGDRVGLVTFSDRVRDFIPPRPGRAQLGTFNEVLYSVRAEYTEPDFGEVFTQISRRVSRRSLVVVLTDVLERAAAGDLVSHAVRLGRRHRVLVVAMTDPALLHARSLPIGRAERAYEWAAAEELLAARRETFESLGRGGVLALEATAGRLSPALVEKYLQTRDRALL